MNKYIIELIKKEAKALGLGWVGSANSDRDQLIYDSEYSELGYIRISDYKFIVETWTNGNINILGTFDSLIEAYEYIKKLK